jgi:acyl-coenzyme A synthetase/AMP-(fatty) acid ligase
LFCHTTIVTNLLKKEERIEKGPKKKAMLYDEKEKKGGREKMSFRNMRNDVSKVPGWLLCICSV